MKLAMVLVASKNPSEETTWRGMYKWVEGCVTPVIAKPLTGAEECTNCHLNRLDIFPNLKITGLEIPSTVSKLDFDNHSLCFQHRPIKELVRAYCVLFACSFDPLVKRSLKLMKLGENIFGERLLWAILSPLYRQFVAGCTQEEMSDTVRGLKQSKVNLMIAPTLETDVGEAETNLDSLYQENYTKTIHLIHLSSYNKPNKSSLRPLCQTKITAHLPADILFNVSTIYASLCKEEKLSSICFLSDAISSLGVEGFKKERQLRALMAKVFKNKLSKTDEDGIFRALPRLYHMGAACLEKRVVLTIDAEYSYVNEAIGLFALAMMKLFNNETPVVWNTYQGYLKGALEAISSDHSLSEEIGVTFGAKIVRGAYLEKERQYARLNGTEDPTNETYEASNESYDRLVDSFLSIVASKPDRCHVIIATHNEVSIMNAVQKMRNLKLRKGIPSVVFGQIFGMAENISVPLAQDGYNVYKSVPYGRLSDVLPYLSRRANENRTVFYGARKERTLLRKEIQSRMLFRN